MGELQYIERDSGALTAPTATNITIEKPQTGRKVTIKLVTGNADTPSRFSRLRAFLKRVDSKVAIPIIESVLVAQDSVLGGQCSVEWPDFFTLEIDQSVHQDSNIWTLVGYVFD